jgi:hypothetical protein
MTGSQPVSKPDRKRVPSTKALSLSLTKDKQPRTKNVVLDGHSPTDGVDVELRVAAGVTPEQAWNMILAIKDYALVHVLAGKK